MTPHQTRPVRQLVGHPGQGGPVLQGQDQVIVPDVDQRRGQGPGQVGGRKLEQVQRGPDQRLVGGPGRASVAT